MINLFNKLQTENLLKQDGNILDLGSGNGRVSELFFKFGYNTTLVDSDREILKKAEENFIKIRSDGLKIINEPIETFEFKENYDGIIISNVLPFQKNKEDIEKIVNNSFNKLNKGGFLYFTLFGTDDDWAKNNKATMSFYTKNESLNFIKEKPYFISEDFGKGLTMKGDIKTWHIFYLLYIK